MKTTVCQIIGVDCAVDPKRTGLARADFDAGEFRITDVVCSSRRKPAQVLADWINAAAGPVLVALDAPLGWPMALRALLERQRAGFVHGPWTAHELFRRRTDDWVAEHVGKRPLDVGADRIARTAHAALRLLEELRGLLKTEFELAWDPARLRSHSAIEVYPGATLHALTPRLRGYKARNAAPAARRAVVRAVAEVLPIDHGRDADQLTIDEIDSMLCVLAGYDFIAGDAVPPPEHLRDTAQVEGWIWTRLPGAERPGV